MTGYLVISHEHDQELGLYRVQVGRLTPSGEYTDVHDYAFADNDDRWFVGSGAQRARANREDIAAAQREIVAAALRDRAAPARVGVSAMPGEGAAL